MILEAERRLVADYSRRLGASGLSPGTSGNLSVCQHDAALMAITPSAMRYDEVDAADVVVMDFESRVVDGERRPSTEFGMHLACYRERSDIAAIVHTHSPQATTLAVLGRELPAVHYMLAYAGTDLVRCAPYRPYGTVALADAAVEALGNGYGCLLQNHGVLACGPDLAHAYALAEQIEFCAGLYLRATAHGAPHILTRAQIDEVIAKLAAYTPQSTRAKGDTHG